jgi:hypothetical protein
MGTRRPPHDNLVVGRDSRWRGELLEGEPLTRLARLTADSGDDSLLAYIP